MTEHEVMAPETSVLTKAPEGRDTPGAREATQVRLRPAGLQQSPAAVTVAARTRTATPAPTAAVTSPPSPAGAGRRVLEGAFGLLEAVELAGEAGLTRLAAECGLPKSTAHRLLEQLAELGAVERHRGNYRMGPQMFHLGHRWQPHPALRSAARQPVRELAERTGVAVGVCTLWKGHVLVLDWAAGKEAEPSAATCRGMTWSWRTAAGKVLMAAAGPTALPGPDPASWLREAADIRARGAAFDREELMPGVCCTAVPLYGRPGQPPLASLCVVTDPAHHLPRLAHAAARTAKVIGMGLRGR
ncbi:helix-turn-helix domain-containing protein [Streptomyces sp. NPDC005423]|uniref:IclR family transcriptional regulator n=1 Tax=Streptomyces sp. NPDC005423 TaxID=3155343 RepID=UPI0033B796AD